MKLKKVISGLLASVMVFSSVVSGIPVTAVASETREGSETGTETEDLGTDGQGYHEVTAGKKVMVSALRGDKVSSAADILGVEPKDNRYWMGEQLSPYTFDENEGSGDFMPSQWIVIDLGYETTEFTSIELSYQQNGWPTKGRIETGNDTVNWDTVATIERQPQGTAEKTFTAKYNTPGTLQRFVRFYFEEVNINASILRTVAVQSIKIMGKHTGDKVVSVPAVGIEISNKDIQGGVYTFDSPNAQPAEFTIKKNPAESTRMLIKWSSSNRAVAQVDGDSLTGTVTPRHAGKTYITATLAADESIKHTVEVNVLNGNHRGNVIAGNVNVMASDEKEAEADRAVNVTDGYVDEWHAWRIDSERGENKSKPVMSEENPVTLTIDLGRNGTEYDEMRISYFRNGAASQYAIETSSSGEEGSWHTVLDVEKTSHSPGNTVDILTKNGLEVQNANGTTQANIAMSDQNVLDNHFRRYVRLRFTGPTTNKTQDLAIMEIEIIGAQSDKIPPVPVGVESFSLKSADSLTLTGKKATAEIVTDVLPANATNQSMSYVTSDELVATIDGNGTITAVGAGDADITVHSAAKHSLDPVTVTVHVDIPTITFNANTGAFTGGQTEKTADLDRNMKVEEPEKPKKQGTVFKGWFTDESGGNEVKFANGVSESECAGGMVLYAHWDDGTGEPESKTVTFDANGGHFGTDANLTAVTADIDANGKVKKPENPTRGEKYAFVAWYDAADQEVKFDKQGVSVSTYEEDTILYARWMNHDHAGSGSASGKVVVTFHANKGKFKIGEGDDAYEKEQHDVEAANGKVTPPSYKLEKEGYTFAGWFTAADGGEQIALEGDGSYACAASTTLYAHWTENANIKLTPGTKFSMEKGQSREITAKVVPADMEVTWTVAPAGAINFLVDENNSKKVTLTANATGLATITATSATDEHVTASVQVEVSTVQVTFDATDGLFADNVKKKKIAADEDGIVEKPADPLSADYEFAGWYQKGTDGAADTKVEFDNEGRSAVPFSPATTLYAHWTEKQPTPAKIKITFHANGGTFAEGTDTKEIEIDKGGVVTQPTASKENYVFAGWYDAEEGGNPIEFDGNGEKVFENEAKLYAHWTEKQPTPETIKITFYANGGIFADGAASWESEIGKGASVTKPVDPIRDGYTFAGWHDAAEGGNPVTFDANGAAVFDSEATLFAHWTQNQVITPPTPDPIPNPESQFKTGAKQTVKGITYKVLDAKKQTVVVMKGMNKKTVTIPATVKIHDVPCKVVQIGSKAFKNCKKLQSLTVGKNVTTISKNAFQNCKKLKKVTLKGTVLKTVQKGAFKKASSTLTVKVPKKIKKSKAKKNKLLKALKRGGIKKVTIK